MTWPWPSLARVTWLQCGVWMQPWMLREQLGGWCSHSGGWCWWSELQNSSREAGEWNPRRTRVGRGGHPSLPLFSPVLPSSNKTQLALPYGFLFLSLSNSKVVFIDFRRIYILHLLSSAMYQTFRLYPRGIMGCMPLLSSEHLLILGLGTRGQESGQKLKAPFILLKSNSGFPPWL